MANSSRPLNPPTGSNPLLTPANPPKKSGKNAGPKFGGDPNRGPAQPINRNRTITGAPKTGRTPKR